MDRNVVIGIVVVLALIVLGWWYWAFMAPIAMAPGQPEPMPAAEDDRVQVLVGAWQSTEDARFVRTFNADGTVADRYTGAPDATVTGNWSFVTDISAELPELQPVEGTRYVKIEFPEEVLYFAITNLTETELSLMYLTGNGILEFTRVQ